MELGCKNFTLVFFLSALPFTDVDNSQENKEKNGTICLPFYNFWLITNIQTFICGFASDIDTFYF